MRLELRLALECPVCRRHIDSALVQETRVRAAIEGHVAYGVCRCGMEVPHPGNKDRNYRRRWRASLARLEKKR